MEGGMEGRNEGGGNGYQLGGEGRKEAEGIFEDC